VKRGKQLISVWNEWEPEDDMNPYPKFKKVVGGKPLLMAVVDWIARDFGVPKAERKRHLVFLALLVLRSLSVNTDSETHSLLLLA
jgi:hypothetical protein